MKRLALLACLLLAVPLAAAEFGHEDDGFPVNIHGETLYPYIPAHWQERHPELVARLLADLPVDDLVPGLPAEVFSPEALGLGDPLNKVNGYTLFPYYPLLTAEVQRLASEYPGLVRLSSAGQSHLGLDLWLLEIADFHNPDMVPLAEREVVYIDGGTHSNEYSGVYFVTEWAQFLLDEYESNETARWIVENRHTFILPMVNPDGSHAFGRVNLIDVNINRNFPATWGTVDEMPVLNWGGLYPASEPETRAVIRVIDEIRPDYVNSIHCCGNLWLHPYGAQQLGHAPDLEMYTRTCTEVFPDLTLEVERIRCGETWSTIYPASGTTLDEGYARVGASSWTYEMSGRGAVAPWGQPVINEDPRLQETESWRGVLHAFLHAEKYGGLPRVVAVEGTADALTVTVANHGYGPLHRAVLDVGGHRLVMDDLVPDAQAQYVVPGSFGAGAVPMQFEWQKRLHPQSNWGDVRLTVELVQQGGRLVGLVPAPVEAPDMSYLLPGLQDHGPAEDSAADAPAKDTPAFTLVLLVAAVAALAFLRRRR